MVMCVCVCERERRRWIGQAGTTKSTSRVCDDAWLVAEMKKRASSERGEGQDDIWVALR